MQRVLGRLSSIPGLHPHPTSKTQEQGGKGRGRCHPGEKPFSWGIALHLSQPSEDGLYQAPSQVHLKGCFSISPLAKHNVVVPPPLPPLRQPHKIITPLHHPPPQIISTSKIRPPAPQPTETNPSSFPCHLLHMVQAHLNNQRFILS